jgi:hypothetical protein
VSNQSRGLRDKRPRRALAFKDAAGEGFAHARYRLIPYESSEAPGSPALLPSVWRNISISKAALRLSIK